MIRSGTGPSGAIRAATVTRTSSPSRVTPTAAPSGAARRTIAAHGGDVLAPRRGPGALPGGVDAPQLGADHDDRRDRAGQDERAAPAGRRPSPR